ncbi:hypothetical protein O3M35_012453 [Rhynocoris fuscipes]|uniref:Uncharacterized protein n=1 Tax=Rhynocoris fuscipes TaxID=488301 RepID=A0AAW1CTU4_9HEMI
MGRLGPKICGLKCSASCTIFGAWGTIQLAALGYSFGIRSVTLLTSVIPDAEAGEVDIDTAEEEYKEKFHSFSQICYHAAIFTAIAFIIGFWQCCNNLRWTFKRTKADTELDQTLRTLKAAIEEEPQTKDKLGTPDTHLKYIKVDK